MLFYSCFTSTHLDIGDGRGPILTRTFRKVLYGGRVEWKNIPKKLPGNVTNDLSQLQPSLLASKNKGYVTSTLRGSNRGRFIREERNLPTWISYPRFKTTKQKFLRHTR